MKRFGNAQTKILLTQKKIMNLILRLSKRGKIKKPFFKLNIIKKKGKKNSFVYDKIGNCNLQRDSKYAYKKIEINWSKILFWLKKGIKVDKKLLKILFLIYTNEKKTYKSTTL